MGGIDPESVTIFNSPILSAKVLIALLIRALSKVFHTIKIHWIIISAITFLSLSVYFVPGPHKPAVNLIEEIFLFASWWVLLGVASSIGLGTGLHTFVLYLGPHIAKVTMVAYECNYIPKMLPSRWSYSTFEDCPDTSGEMSVWTIIYAVQLESFLWGLGTALGELPPYFIALAARIANTKSEELEEIEELEKSNSSFMHRVKVFMANCLKNYGFITVLLCASIPNPLFDLAGLLCGHFGIPLYEFLGATIIGKAVIKVHIQMLFTIFLCGGHNIDDLVILAENNFTFLGNKISTALAKHKKMLHSPNVDTGDKTIIATIWEWVIISMITFFIVSMLNSLIRGELTTDTENKNKRKRPKRKPKKKSK
ncbi:hypothetical protein SteCoe_28272 [Stentor coeruleus]|uniref:Vacuole membrane protein 1 n=1 Tax=Stentor coeruleus TaxID=5963 RepID=A0A1R2B8W5_9CILI|nr:hypothetical protein SteCoe_28272 [Stentor coeruleus]